MPLVVAVSAALAPAASGCGDSGGSGDGTVGTANWNDAGNGSGSGSTGGGNGNGGSKGDGGASVDGGDTETTNQNFSTPNVCTSNTFWTRGDHGSADMHPGGTCITCHQSSGGDDAPTFSIAGTVYPTAHEPDDCNGKSGIDVVITDANGQVITLQSSPTSGNFSYRGSIAFPYTAEVVSNGVHRHMGGKQTVGDCNACHSQDGTNDAPGRIMAP